MYGVYAPDADAVRRLIPTVERLFDWPYCSYLIYLARRVDHEAIAFLERYARAVHEETGEVIAVIVLFDQIEVLGTVRGREGLGADEGETPSIVTDARIAYGSYPIRGDQVPRKTSHHLFTASPQWSLKFADALGLSRSFVPCIVAFDHSGREGSARSEECVILDISDADEAWETLRDAIAGFMTVPAAQQFGLAAERLRTLRFDLTAAERAFEDSKAKFAPTYLVPTTARGLLEILRQPSHPDRAAVIDLIEHPPNGITSTVLNRVIQNVAVLRAVVNYNVTADRLRQTWVNVELEPNSVPASLRRRLANALSITGREPSAAEVDRLLTADATERSRFVDAVEDAGKAELSAITQALKTAHTPAHHQARLRLQSLQAEIQVVRDSLRPEPFLPHLAAAIDSRRPIAATTRESRLALPKKVVGATSFAASVAQILQSIGVLH